jgi:glutamine synthetase
MHNNSQSRINAISNTIFRVPNSGDIPRDDSGNPLKVSEYFGQNVFEIQSSRAIPAKIKKELADIAQSERFLPASYAEVVANALTEWATERGASHFCHWFQPLTGGTAEKHDAFLSYDNDEAIEKFSAGQLVQGEPDASSFPNGGSRSTFEARGYTAWDMTSPIFLKDGVNGRTLCIPTAFVSYEGEALDVKTPLLRSVGVLSDVASEFVSLTSNEKCKFVRATCGVEQEYFLVDRAFAALRPDLVMTRRCLIGSMAQRNQQLSDHYFGTIPSRVLAFMQDFEAELYRLGIPAKTRHNEVAPGQFELAPIFRDANVANDHNQLVMAVMKEVAERHDFVAILHEKPFAGINGSGKHLNWSMSDDKGKNLLKPGKKPEQNLRFLTLVSAILEGVYRHADFMRMSISGAGNDHRLGANEAPPSVISVFLGDTLNYILQNIKNGKSSTVSDEDNLDLGADQLATIVKDNTDRNRTSPFAFTGDKFEFRAVGSSQNIGFPLSIVNAAVSEVLAETNEILKEQIGVGKTKEQAMNFVTKKWLDSCFDKIVFNGDGYSEEWLELAASRGLSNLKTTADALEVLRDEKQCEFVVKQDIYRSNELKTRYHVYVENYILVRKIEFKTLINLIDQHVLPASFAYKKELLGALKDQKELNLGDSFAETQTLNEVDKHTNELYRTLADFKKRLANCTVKDESEESKYIAHELQPITEVMAAHVHEIENIIPDQYWSLPKNSEMLFIR